MRVKHIHGIQDYPTAVDSMYTHMNMHMDSVYTHMNMHMDSVYNSSMRGPPKKLVMMQSARAFFYYTTCIWGHTHLRGTCKLFLRTATGM